jgi:hypothetical protein
LLFNLTAVEGAIAERASGVQQNDESDESDLVD